MDQIRRDRDDCDDSCVEVVFYSKLHETAGPAGFIASQADAAALNNKGGSAAIPELVKKPARSLSGLATGLAHDPPHGHGGEWALRLCPTADDVYVWPDFGLRDPLGNPEDAAMSPMSTPKPADPLYPPHPKKDYGKFHVTLQYKRSDSLLHVEWDEIDGFGHNCNHDSRWFHTDIIRACGCGPRDDDDWKSVALGVDGTADCVSGCLAGFGLRGWTEHHGYQRQKISDVHFKEGCGAPV